MICNILDYGAVGDGKTLCTDKVQAAIDACVQGGGGTVVVPAGTFRIGTIWLGSHVELHLVHGAVLKASTCLEDYNAPDAYPQNSTCEQEKWCGAHLIIALEQEDVAITGSGVIEGCAEEIYGGELKFCNNACWREGYYQVAEGKPLRPGQMVCFIECDHVRVSGVTLRSATCWNLFLHGCHYAHITGLTIFGKKQHVNNDGIDLDTCRYVTVSDCVIDTGDDALAIRCRAERLSAHPDRKDCAYINISNCMLSTSACAIRFGVGNGSIHHINVSNLTVERSGGGFSFLTGWGGAIAIHDVLVQDVIAEDIGVPFQLYGDQAPIRRVTLRNFRSGCSLAAHVEGEASDIALRDVELYDIPPIVPCPDMLRQQRTDAMLNLRSVDHVALDHVRLFGRETYFDDRPLGVHAVNCRFDTKDVRFFCGDREIEE